MTNLDRYKEDFSKLVNLGDRMNLGLVEHGLKREGKQLDDKMKARMKEYAVKFEDMYQGWFIESCAIIKQLLPERLNEFNDLYKADSKHKGLDELNFSIQDWLINRRATEFAGTRAFKDFEIIVSKFRLQLSILKSIEGRFTSSLFNIKQLLQADLFDSELDAARELLKKGFLRSAGIIAGVVLESHFSQVCVTRRLAQKHKHPSLGDFNELLKANEIIDVPQFRFLQRLSDLRNLCGHKKDREPTKDEVTELIDGVEKTTKTLY